MLLSKSHSFQGRHFIEPHFFLFLDDVYPHSMCNDWMSMHEIIMSIICQSLEVAEEMAAFRWLSLKDIHLKVVWIIQMPDEMWCMLHVHFVTYSDLFWPVK